MQPAVELTTHWLHCHVRFISIALWKHILEQLKYNIYQKTSLSAIKYTVLIRSPYKTTESWKVLADEPFLLLPAWVAIDFFAPESCLLKALLLSPCGTLHWWMPFNTLPCFPASHYHSVELINLLTAGAVLRLLSLISNSYSIPAVFFFKQRHFCFVDSGVCLLLIIQIIANYLCNVIFDGKKIFI